MLGNLATLAGTSLVRYMVWDGMRAVDYLLARDDVDAERIAVTGTSGGGFQSLWLGALDRRIRAVLPSCFPTAATRYSWRNPSRHPRLSMSTGHEPRQIG